MTVTSPPSLSKIIAEFKGPNNLGAYNRGGPYVPDTAANAAISTTAAGLKISQFAGAQAYTPVSAAISATSASGNAFGTASTQYVTSIPVTATCSGGSGSYTYSWERVSGATFGLTAPVSPTTQFGATVNLNSSVTGVYRCKISDGTSTAYTPNVTITLTYSSKA